MARKLTEEERNNINLLTAAFVAALPAHLRSHAGAVASSLVRIPREVIKPADVNRIVGRCGENAKQKDELRAVIRELALEPVETEDGAGEQFQLRIPDADEPVAEMVAAREAAAVEAAAAEAVAQEPEAAEPVQGSAEEPAEEPTKPKRRRRRRVGDKGGVAAAEQADVAETESEGEGALAAEEPVAEVAAEAPAETPADAASDQPEVDAAEEAPAPEKKRRRTRRSRKKAAPAAEEAAAPSEDVTPSEAAVAEAPASDPAAEPEAVPEPAPIAEPAEAEPETDAAAEPEKPAAPEAAVEPETAIADDAPATSEDAAPAQRNSRGRGRRGGNGRGQNGNPKQQGKSLAEVPYIRRGGQTEADLRARIVQLDQRFWLNGWLLSHPGAFQLYEKELLALNEFVVSGTMIGDVTRRQLAYQMGGDEKFFEYGSDGFKLLRSMGVEDLIRHRPMPKADLVFHAPIRRKHMRVLVTENLDPWLDVHDLMYEEGATKILGERIHAVVLGGGMPVLEQNRLHLLLDTLHAETYEVLYWGDIDRAGLDILIKLRSLLDGKFEVKPFTPAYQLMCDRAMERFPDPENNERTGQINIEVGDTSVICDGLTPEAADYARAVIEGCGLIPQEILTKRDIK